MGKQRIRGPEGDRTHPACFPAAGTDTTPQVTGKEGGIAVFSGDWSSYVDKGNDRLGSSKLGDPVHTFERL